ncbi:DNA-binding transcriptional regulator, MerR family [Amycolatopsis marina]|uniref:DNA-binding transcriptional regulator, MerR family n=1 Tax=Amycolatopsis marina TaxID=490629 RepID=A0A1I1C2U1_9PSEU|nr:MerR family transcriptional regulator [Amycolatopsis marina]SFB56871.1 DNA-binding transcriptional regulator, MerR family [Amycolatopsis marina]
MTTFHISQLAERAGVKPTTLRFYEQAGLLPARRSESGYRLYDDEAVERLEFIASGKHLGLPLDEIRDLLTVWEDGLCTDVRSRLRPMLLARIADAQQRAAELEAFTDRLRDALAEVDGPPRPGRCDPSCGFLHQHQHSPAPAPVEFSLRRPPVMSEPAPIACTLTGGEQAERIAQWQQLLDGAERESIDGGLLLRLPAELAGPVADLAAAEQHCCAFFEFTLRLLSGGMELEVRAPAEAAPLLADVFGTAD